MIILYYAVGAVFGLAMLLPFLKSSVSTLTENGYLALASMLMIYIGAHLVSSDLFRIVIETVFSMVILGFAIAFRFKWPVGVGILILLHALYDFLFGHASGIVDWYPPMCVGFDVVVGCGLILLILKKQRNTA